MSKELQLLQEQMPFLTLFEYAGEEGIGIIQNYGKTCVSVYVIGPLMSSELRARFVELAGEWWWNSNRKIPINLFFKQDFDIFKRFIVNHATKEFKIISGHSVSLQGLNNKRVKRRRIELVIKSK